MLFLYYKYPNYWKRVPFKNHPFSFKIRCTLFYPKEDSCSSLKRGAVISTTSDIKRRDRHVCKILPLLRNWTPREYFAWRTRFFFRIRKPCLFCLLCCRLGCGWERDWTLAKSGVLRGRNEAGGKSPLVAWRCPDSISAEKLPERRRSHGVMVSTLDFESSDPSSNLGGTSLYNQPFLQYGLRNITATCKRTRNNSSLGVTASSMWRRKGCVIKFAVLPFFGLCKRNEYYVLWIVWTQ